MPDRPNTLEPSAGPLPRGARPRWLGTALLGLAFAPFWGALLALSVAAYGGPTAFPFHPLLGSLIFLVIVAPGLAAVPLALRFRRGLPVPTGVVFWAARVGPLGLIWLLSIALVIRTLAR